MRAAAITPDEGFMSVKEGVDETIRNVANDPSVGLFFVQQHARATMPVLLSSQKYVQNKAHETNLHTEDNEDSICAMRSITEHGLAISDEMIKEIKKSLMIMSTKQPKRGLIQNPRWGHPTGRTSLTIPLEPISAGGTNSQAYLTTMFSTAMQKAAAGFKWPQPDFSLDDRSTEVSTSSNAANASTPSAYGEEEELPVSSPSFDDHTAAAAAGRLQNQEMPAMLESYERFRSEQELKLQEWLQEGGEDDGRTQRQHEN